MASYRVDIDRPARKEIRRLPGNICPRVIRALRAPEQDPYPHTSRALDWAKAGVDAEPGVELRRIRLASWRIVYLIEEEWKLVSVLAVRKRPPYQYDDLNVLLEKA